MSAIVYLGTPNEFIEAPGADAIGPTTAPVGKAAVGPSPLSAASVQLDFVSRNERLDLDDEITCAPCAIGAAIVAMGSAFYGIVWAFELLRQLMVGAL